MAGTNLVPEKITSPFQLMAAWFSMLVLITSVLLTAAINIERPTWAAGYIVVFTSILIVLALGCVTLMLTVFRPNLQEGKKYAQWLKDRNKYSAGVVRTEQLSKSARRSRPPQRKPSSRSNKKDIHIDVTNTADSGRLIRALSADGFDAQLYIQPALDDDEFNQPEDHEAIWVGYELLASDVIGAIKIAVREWPRLKYVHLSNDGNTPPDEVHRQIYFGGSTSTAEDYGLQSWTNEELLDLDESMSQTDFHRLIRSKYG